MAPISTWCARGAGSLSCRAATTPKRKPTAIMGRLIRMISAVRRRPMLDYDFMQNAFAAAAIVAIVSGLVGYFLVLRGQTFAGHALAHVGFTGATGAALIGFAPLWGLVALTVSAGLGMGALGERLAQRDVAIGI